MRIQVIAALSLVCALSGASTWSDELPVVESVSGASDASGHTSFFEGDNWSNGLPPGPGTNYVWSGFNLRTPDSNVAAYKDLLTVSFPPGGGGGLLPAAAFVYPRPCGPGGRVRLRAVGGWILA